MLDRLDIDGKALRWLKSLYWEQTATVRVENKLSEWITIERGVRQGCVLSPDVSSLYSEIILREIEELHEVPINGHNINQIRYADDTVLIDEAKNDLQCILKKVVEKSESLGLSLNEEKTYSMIASKKKNPLICKLTGNGVDIKQVETFN